MILSDNRIEIKRRINPIYEAEVSIENNSLYVESEGSVRGIQLTIDSKEYLNINDNINMDISYNVVENKHYILIYGMQGNSLNDGVLFESVDSFEIIE